MGGGGGGLFQTGRKCQAGIGLNFAASQSLYEDWRDVQQHPMTNISQSQYLYGENMQTSYQAPIYYTTIVFVYYLYFDI